MYFFWIMFVLHLVQKKKLKTETHKLNEQIITSNTDQNDKTVKNAEDGDDSDTELNGVNLQNIAINDEDDSDASNSELFHPQNQNTAQSPESSFIEWLKQNKLDDGKLMEELVGIDDVDDLLMF